MVGWMMVDDELLIVFFLFFFFRHQNMTPAATSALTAERLFLFFLKERF